MNAAGGGVHTAEPVHDRKQRRAVGLWLLVIAQIAIPASYYLRGERDDERFAWRMFSVVRAQTCRVRAYGVNADARKTDIDVGRTLHTGWAHSLERGRLRVIDRFLADRCRRDGLVGSELWRRCEGVVRSGERIERFVLDCRTRKLVRESIR